MQYPSSAKRMHHKCFFDAIPITNHNVFSIVSLFGSRWVLHILDLFFQSRCNTHRAPKICIINFHRIKYPSQTIMFFEIYHCLFGDGYCIFDFFFKVEAIPITHQNKIKNCKSVCFMKYLITSKENIFDRYST